MFDTLKPSACSASALSLAMALSAAMAQAAPAISRLTPPSQLFATGGAEATPYIARFIAGQRFDLQATVQPEAGKNIISVVFAVDGGHVGTVPSANPNTSLVTTGLVRGLAPNTVVASYRAYSNLAVGAHLLTATATDNTGATTVATGNFEVVGTTPAGRQVKNVIIMLGDGMGASHRTAARIMLKGVAQGKAKGQLVMDTFPSTAMIMTASLNSIVTDSAPGMQNYVTGNKASNNQEGVWPDDTTAAFDNPRVEYLAEFVARTQGKKLGIVTTADVFDATPASMAVHTQARGNGTGIVDQFFDDRALTGLTVLMGGGRKWFLPNPTNCPGGSPPGCGSAAGFNGSARANSSDYTLPPDIVAGWGAAPGALDPARDLIGAFTAAGWAYTATKSDLAAASSDKPLLGLFSLSNMNIALDKISGRRGDNFANPPAAIAGGGVVADYGFPDQPMLDEMTQKALDVLDASSPNGFVLLVEGASIDKQAHNMDSERWILDTIELDRAIGVAKRYASSHPDTLVLATADHECAGAVIIGASTVTNADLIARSTSGLGTSAGGPRQVVGTYESAGFPAYAIAPDGYPITTDPDKKMLLGYGANADRYEDWLTNPQPLRDSQQPGNNATPLSTYPHLPVNRDIAGNFLVTGQIPDTIAAHTGGDVPLSAYGRGAALFGGTMDNTDVFFKVMQAVIGGAGQ